MYQPLNLIITCRCSSVLRVENRVFHPENVLRTPPIYNASLSQWTYSKPSHLVIFIPSDTFLTVYFSGRIHIKLQHLIRITLWYMWAHKRSRHNRHITHIWHFYNGGLYSLLAYKSRSFQQDFTPFNRVFNTCIWFSRLDRIENSALLSSAFSSSSDTFLTV